MTVSVNSSVIVRPTLKLFTAEPEPDDTRIIHPGVPPVVAIPPAPPSSERLYQASLFEAISLRHQERKREIPPEERETVRRSQTLFEFWDTWIRSDREAAVAADKLAKGTLDKERQILSRFRAWELRFPPADWPKDATWPGLPLGYLTGPYIEGFLRSLKSAGSVESTWNHIRAVLNQAKSLKVLRETPTPDVASVIKDLEPVDSDDDLLPTSYTLVELGAVYRAVEGDVELQVGWCTGAAIGPRTEDLFGLSWANFKLDVEIPFASYTAEKTGKKHWVPLAPITVAQLKRLRPPGQLIPTGPVFPSLAGHQCKVSAKSKAARRRNAAIKRALKSVGIEPAGDYSRPWQVLRSTATSRLNNHRAGAGRLITHGPDADVNSQHYWNFRDLIVDAVMTLPQPPEFSEF